MGTHFEAILQRQVKHLLRNYTGRKKKLIFDSPPPLFLSMKKEWSDIFLEIVRLLIQNCKKSKVDKVRKEVNKSVLIDLETGEETNL